MGLGYVIPIFCAALLASCGNNKTDATQDTPPQLAAQSGYHYQSPAEQALQDDTFANPGYLWVDEGATLFQRSQEPDGRLSCASCHSQPPVEQEAENPAHNWVSAATRYPTWDQRQNRVISLEERINHCRAKHQWQAPHPWESRELLALTTYVAHQAKGQPIKAAAHSEDIASSKRGEAYYQRRKGQLNLACRHCHELNPGKMLRGDRLSQGLPTGYPAYKLEWQTLGSLQRRLRDCDAGVRAQRWGYGAQVYIDVERYLKDRAAGLLIETPAVRR